MIKNKRIHLVGIGGVSMQGLAQVLQKWGNEVSGSDLNKSSDLKRLKQEGIKVHIGHSKDNLSHQVDLVIKSDAIPDDNPELQKAVQNNILILRRAQMIQKMVEDRKLVAVAGTHGKSTLSAMIAFVLTRTGYDPLAFLGAKLPEWNSVSRDGRGQWAVVEACEYKSQFWFFKPEISLITNIEEEHMDYYKDLSDIKSSYLKFVNQTNPQGSLLVYDKDQEALEVAERSDLNFVTYGSEKADFPTRSNLDLQVFGHHNYLNATGALAVCDIIGVPASRAQEAISQFSGVCRRSQLVGRKNGVVVYDDYAHHPSEIETTLQAFQDNFDRKILVVFQPHQSQRLTSLFNEFKKSLKGLGQLILVETYNPAGRDEKTDNDAVQLAQELEEEGTDVSYAKDYKDALKKVEERAKGNDLILTMGAGPVDQVGKKYLQGS